MKQPLQDLQTSKQQEYQLVHQLCVRWNLGVLACGYYECIQEGLVGVVLVHIIYCALEQSVIQNQQT